MLITLNNLSIYTATKKLCDKLSICMRPGETWGILGRNGSGKTSLLLTLAGLRKINSGEIFLDAKILDTLSHLQRARKLALLFQEYEDYFPATVLETVLIGRHPHNPSWQWENKKDRVIAQQILEQLSIAELKDQPISSLSGGERRLVAIAAILARQANIFLLDEPTNHLDINHQHQVLKIFHSQAKQQNKTVIMCLHDINQAQRYCDNIIILLPDGAVLAGATAEILTEKNLTRAYQHLIKEIVVDGMKFFMQGDLVNRNVCKPLIM